VALRLVKTVIVENNFLRELKMSNDRPANPTGQGNQASRGADGGQPGMGGQEARSGQGSQGGMNSQNTWPNNPNGKGKYGTPSEQAKEDEPKPEKPE
jgi:hypothetical protein